MMGRTNQSNRRLIRALGERFGPFEALEVRTLDWASMTFSGVVHHLSFIISADAATLALIQTIDEAEWPMVGQFVADILVTDQQSVGPGRIRLSMEALTIFEA